MSDKLVVVFVRNPELGQVKKRLAKTIGNVAALEIYKFLLNHTENTIRAINCDKAVFYSTIIIKNDIWDDFIYKKYQQKGADLGERMLNAFEVAFNNKYRKVVIVGSDLFDLESRHIEDAFTKLESYDVVIGPAKDGGYYLLGLKSLNRDIFKNKIWGTATVLQDTIQDLKHIDVHLLEELNDIDEYKDIKNISEFKPFL